MIIEIQDFRKIRKDGKVIDESMTARDMLALGWSPDKVTEVQWHVGSSQISFRAPNGVLAQVIPGRQRVAVIEESVGGERSSLWIINSDGTRHLQVPNSQIIKGREILGDFGWLEKSRINSPDVFGVIFGDRKSGLMFHLDIDATNGSVLGAYESR